MGRTCSSGKLRSPVRAVRVRAGGGAGGVSRSRGMDRESGRVSTADAGSVGTRTVRTLPRARSRAGRARPAWQWIRSTASRTASPWLGGRGHRDRLHPSRARTRQLSAAPCRTRAGARSSTMASTPCGLRSASLVPLPRPVRHASLIRVVAGFEDGQRRGAPPIPARHRRPGQGNPRRLRRRMFGTDDRPLASAAGARCSLRAAECRQGRAQTPRSERQNRGRRRIGVPGAGRDPAVDVRWVPRLAAQQTGSDTCSFPHQKTRAGDPSEKTIPRAGGVVETKGVEPSTYALRTRRSTN